MWLTVAVGAAINIFPIWLFKLQRGVDLLLGGLISFYTATMICLIALLDNPRRGEVGVSTRGVLIGLRPSDEVTPPLPRH